MGNQIQKPQLNHTLMKMIMGKKEPTFTCEICFKTATIPNMFKKRNAATFRNMFKNRNKCVHPFCTDCMIKYIQVKLEDNVSEIKCPAMTCNHFLDPLLCRPKMTHQLFNKWCDALYESMVLGINRVYCPNKECLELILNECGDRSLERCVCSYCKKPFCYECKVPWHDDFYCGEIKDENDKAFDFVYKAKKWRRCPNCRYCVEHVGGCNIIRCRCGTTFCYVAPKACVTRR